MTVREWLESNGTQAKWGAIVTAVVGAFVLGLILDELSLGSMQAEVDGRPRPAEFLYLDNERVGAYLAQLDGGTATSERLTETLIAEDSAKVSAGGFEVGASAQRENFVERQVTPTAAANYLRLFSILKKQERLPEVGVESLSDFQHLGEGEFVRFESEDLRTPIYANSYLVVRQAGTLKALFPTGSASGSERDEILEARDNAESYARQVGPDPRIVFALKPKEDETIKFLLPVRYRQLTNERSLIKGGGGRFTVVGKLIRAFRQPPAGDGYAYVDSPTLETWRKPLERVPAPLLERSSALCEAKRRAEAGKPSTPPVLRHCILKQLRTQTRIPKRGAVILPIAIYK